MMLGKKVRCNDDAATGWLLLRVSWKPEAKGVGSSAVEDVDNKSPALAVAAEWLALVMSNRRELALCLETYCMGSQNRTIGSKALTLSVMDSEHVAFDSEAPCY